MKGSGTEKKNKESAPPRPFLWFLAVIGLILIAYFTINIALNLAFAVDSASKGVPVVWKEATYDESGQMVSGPEGVVLRGINAWVEELAPWLATNTYLLVLGSIFLAFGLAYALARREGGELAVFLFEMRLLGAYLGLVALLMVALGIDRVYFIPHGPRSGTLGWIDWYILEFLAHILWAAVLAVLAAFYLRLRGKDEGDASPSETV